MTSRRDLVTQPYCWLCCCGCLPFLGILKGAVCVVPCTIYFTVVIVGMTLALLPCDIYYSYRSFMTTPRLGPNIKIAIAILLPVPIVLWPAVAAIGALVFSLLFSLFYPVDVTFDENKPLCYGGIPEVFNGIFNEFPKVFWTTNLNNYFNFLEDYRIRPLADNEHPFDIPMYWIPLGIILAAMGIAVVVPAAALIVVIKYIPAVCWLYIHMYDAYCKANEFVWQVVLFLPFIAANALIPFVVLLMGAIFILVSIFMGATAATTAYQKGLEAGMRRTISNIYDLDEWTNQQIFKCPSCLQCFDLGERFAA